MGTNEAAVASVGVLRALPKVELHVHLEGAFDASRIEELADEVGEHLPRPVDQLFDFADLDAFLAFLDWSCGLVRDDVQAERAAYDFAARAHGDGTQYAEVIVNPTHWSAWDVADLVTALAAGFDGAVDDGLADCRLLLSLSRWQSGDEALALVRWMAATCPERVVGLSIDGNEERAGRTGDRFAPAFRMARDEGFGCVAHAGESSGPKGVRDALDFLGVHRIDHGVRASEDLELVARLADGGTTLDVCLTSNLVLRRYESLDHHPLARLLDAGVAVTLNTDDPSLMDTDLTAEFVLASHHLSWSLSDAAARVRTAIDAAFCEPERAAALRRALDRFLTGRDPDAAPC